MGLLDDAIREHLQLKLRQGSDPRAVVQLEREALGSPTAEELQQPDTSLAARQEADSADWSATSEDEVDAISTASPRFAADLDVEIEFPTSETTHQCANVGEPGHEEPAQQFKVSPGDRNCFSADESPVGEDEQAEAFVVNDQTPRSDVTIVSDDPESELDYPYSADSSDPQQSVEDLLEETPEFLQDMPEHDRLWFEQTPPRDFNFEN